MREIRLTVAQAAKEIGESVHVVRNWLGDFRPYIPVEKSDAGYNLFTQESINVLKKIQHMARVQKLKTRQIEAILAGAEMPVADEEAGSSLAEEIKEIKELLTKQQEFNAALVTRLDEQQKTLETAIKRRDEQVYFMMNEIREQKKLTAAARERKPKWKFWRKD